MIYNKFSRFLTPFNWLGTKLVTKTREEALRRQVASDSHSTSKFRVNGVVRNIPEFYTAFNIKPTDSLYLAPDKRVQIWYKFALIDFYFKQKNHNYYKK